MKPNEVYVDNQQEAWENLYHNELRSAKAYQDKKKSKQRFVYIAGDYARISFLRQPFDRGYNQRFTTEIFKVKYCQKTKPPTYKLEDFAGEELIGSFYSSELVKTKPPEDNVYKVEKIILSKKIPGKLMYLVKWLGWSDKFNSYVTKDELKDLKS